MGTLAPPLRQGPHAKNIREPPPPPPPCDIPSGCCFFTEPWTVTRSSLRMFRRVAAFRRPPRPVLLRVSCPPYVRRRITSAAQSAPPP